MGWAKYNRISSADKWQGYGESCAVGLLLESCYATKRIAFCYFSLNTAADATRGRSSGPLLAARWSPVNLRRTLRIVNCSKKLVFELTQ